MPANVIDVPQVPKPVLLGTLQCGDHFVFPDDPESVSIYLSSHGFYDSLKTYATYCFCVRVKDKHRPAPAFRVYKDDTAVMKRPGLRSAIEFEG